MYERKINMIQDGQCLAGQWDAGHLRHGVLCCAYLLSGV